MVKKKNKFKLFCRIKDKRKPFFIKKKNWKRKSFKSGV